MSSDKECKEGNPLKKYKENKERYEVNDLTFNNDAHASYSNTYEVLDKEKEKSYIIKKIAIGEGKTDDNKNKVSEKRFYDEIKMLNKLKGITPNLVKCWIHTDKKGNKSGYIALDNYCWNDDKKKKYKKCGTVDDYFYEEINGSIYMEDNMTVKNYKKKIRELKDKYYYLEDYDKLEEKKIKILKKLSKALSEDKINDYRKNLKDIEEDLEKVEEFKKQKDLYKNIIYNIKRFNETRRWAVLQIFKEIKKIHKKEVIIWDVRLPNILYRYSSKNGYEFVIIDFGVSHKKSKSEDAKELNLIDMLFDYIALVFDTFDQSTIAPIITMGDNKNYKYISLRRLKYYEREIYDEIKQVYKKYKEGKEKIIDKKFKFYFDKALDEFNS